MSVDIADQKVTETQIERDLERITRRTLRHRKINGWLWSTWVAWLLIYYLLKFGLKYNLPSPIGFVFPYLAVTVLTHLLGHFFIDRRAIRSVAESDDVRAISILMDVAFCDGIHYDGTTRHAAIAALIRLLPRIQSDNVLSPAHVKALRSILSLDGYIAWGNHYPPGLVLATLQCLLAIGDTEILKAVEKLSTNAREAEVRKAAVAALPALREQIPVRRSTDTLLRPVSSEDSSLLRAASSATTDEQTLLTPSDQPS